MIKNFFKHLHTINKHRFIVCKYCFKAGIPIRGLLHDLSKYSPVEFFEGVKYYSGKKSPISICKKEKGYSKAWLHHKGRNKHHFEYWLDLNTPNKTPMPPYKYVIEMICDTIAASIVYHKNDWTPESNLNYFDNRKDLEYINENLKKLLREVYVSISKIGINNTLNKTYLKSLYKKYNIE